MRTMITLAAALVGLGCSDTEPECGTDKPSTDCEPVFSDTDTDTDTDTDADADSDTDTDADTGTLDGRDGVYTGTLHVEVTELAFDDVCETAFTVTVDTLGTPAVQASGSCTFTGLLAGNTLEVSLDGDITEPDAAGFASVTYPAMGTQAEQWDGAFSDPDRLQGRVNGSWPQGGASVLYDVTFDVSR